MQGSFRGQTPEGGTLTLGQWDEGGSETLLAPLDGTWSWACGWKEQHRGRECFKFPPPWAAVGFRACGQPGDPSGPLSGACVLIRWGPGKAGCQAYREERQNGTEAVGREPGAAKHTLGGASGGHRRVPEPKTGV